MAYNSGSTADMTGLDVDQLPLELRQQAKKEKRSQGGYRYDSPADRQHIKQQRAAIWAWIRGVGGHLIKHGVNLTNLPLPAELCEARSYLQRLTDSWRCMDLLHAAGAASDPVERLKLVVAFAVGGMRQQVSCDKPFNPILGETLQGSFACGCSVFAEQVSHHPPVSCWQLLDHNGQFQYSGSSCWSATFAGNSVKGSQTGDSRLRCASDGAVITWSLPSIHISGVLFGDRVVQYHDTIVFADKQNGLRCELFIDIDAPSKRKGLVKRIIGKARHSSSRAAPDQVVGELVRLVPGGGEVLLDCCSGSWLSELAWDKGVRSVIMPSASHATPNPAQTATAAAGTQRAAAVDEDAGSVGCHSIGSFSTTSSSSSNAGGECWGAEAGDVQPASSSSDANGSSSSSSCGSRLTAGALAAHTQETAGDGAAAAAALGQVPSEGAAAAVASSAAPSSCGAAGHRCGKGISVTKQLWDAKASKVWQFMPLPDDDAQLLPSDHRHRPDVQAHGGGAHRAALHWKLALEQRQRRDRALREQAGVSEHGGHIRHHRHSISCTKLGSAEELAAAEEEPGQPASDARQD